jgi:S-formylglutathione hydrolase FrmB
MSTTSSPHRIRRLALLVATLAALGLLGTSVARANQLVTITIPAAKGEIASKWLDYPGPPRAQVLLPAGYNPRRRYPLVVALNGLNCDYVWWAASGLAQELDNLGAIVVMPEGGSGWYTDWWNNGERGGPSWETYFLDQVMPTILSRYRLLPQRRYHALIGISMGGLGATYLGGRLPGFFGSVATLSGFVDPEYFAQLTGPAMGYTSLAPFKGDLDMDSVMGAPNGFYMDGHNPTKLVMNLKQTRVFESTGTGLPSSADLAQATTTVGPEGPVYLALERLVIYPMSQNFHTALVADGVNVTYQIHPGGHLIPDFQKEVKAMIAWGLFKPVVTHPSSWTNQTVATSGQLWDIGYRFSQPPDRVVTFRRAGDRLTVSRADAAVTLTTSGGCAIHTATPGTVEVPARRCRPISHHKRS